MQKKKTVKFTAKVPPKKVQEPPKKKKKLKALLISLLVLATLGGAAYSTIKFVPEANDIYNDVAHSIHTTITNWRYIDRIVEVEVEVPVEVIVEVPVEVEVPVYIDVPGETVYVEVEVPGETVYIDVPGETVYVEVEVPVIQYVTAPNFTVKIEYSIDEGGNYSYNQYFIYYENWYYNSEFYTTDTQSAVQFANRVFDIVAPYVTLDTDTAQALWDFSCDYFNINSPTAPSSFNSDQLSLQYIFSNELALVKQIELLENPEEPVEEPIALTYDNAMGFNNQDYTYFYGIPGTKLFEIDAAGLNNDDVRNFLIDSIYNFHNWFIPNTAWYGSAWAAGSIFTLDFPWAVFDYEIPEGSAVLLNQDFDSIMSYFVPYLQGELTFEPWMVGVLSIPVVYELEVAGVRVDMTVNLNIDFDLFQSLLPVII